MMTSVPPPKAIDDLLSLVDVLSTPAKTKAALDKIAQAHAKLADAAAAFEQRQKDALADLIARARTLDDKDVVLAQAKREADAASKRQADDAAKLVDRNTVLAAKSAEHEARQQALDAREATLDGRHKELADRAAALADREVALAARAQALDLAKADYAKASAAHDEKVAKLTDFAQRLQG